MSDVDRSARFIAERTLETDIQAEARRLALEHGIRPPSALAGQAIAGIAAATRAARILELGGGVGTTSLWIRRGVPRASLTIIEEEAEWTNESRRLLLRDGASPATLRHIAGRTADVLPRMSEGGYELVVLADDAPRFAARLQHAIRLAAPGGTIAALGALRGGAVADPARRDPVTNGMREIIAELERHPDFVVALWPIGGGILQLTKRATPDA